jgi:hypothetical protein
MPLSTKHYYSTISNVTVICFLYTTFPNTKWVSQIKKQIASEAPDTRLTKTLKQLLRICYLNTILGEEQQHVGEIHDIKVQ